MGINTIRHRTADNTIKEKAAELSPSLNKKNVTPHTFRHSAAMNLLQAGVDISTIAIWLGHESIETTHKYMVADIEIKRQAMEKLDETDSVKGIKGGKVLLTVHFVNASLMLAFLRNSNDSQSVIDIFDRLYLELRPDIFMELFPVILADNASEFSNPSRIEFDSQGNRRTRLFYCDPSAPYQKGAAENNHEFIRRIIPKGTDLALYTQDQISLMMSHINSYLRKALGNRSPYDTFAFQHGAETLEKFGLRRIPCDEIILSPELLK